MPDVPTGFPFHTCPKSTKNVPYAFSDFTATNNGDSVTYCTTVESHAATSGSCSAMDFNKLELLINPICYKAVTGISVNGAPKATSWQRYQNGKYLTLKFTALETREFAGVEPVGSSMCLTVQSGECTDLRTLTMGSSFKTTIFNSNNKCCPTYSIPYPY